MIRLVGITGLAGSGKDTAADALVLEEGFAKVSFAAPMKAMLTTLLAEAHVAARWDDRDWKEATGALGYSPRVLSQTLGTEWGRQTLDSDFWVRLADANWRMAGCPPTVLSDVRFKSEARWVRRMGGLVIQVVRPDAGEVAAHSSEAGLPESMIDYVVNNDGSIGVFCDQVRMLVKSCQAPPIRSQGLTTPLI